MGLGVLWVLTAAVRDTGTTMERVSGDGEEGGQLDLAGVGVDEVMVHRKTTQLYR